MYDNIVQIDEIRDDKNGVDIVNQRLSEGWKFIAAIQVGTKDAMDIVYVIGATSDVLKSQEHQSQNFNDFLKSKLGR